jgi:hypothetical protein
LKHVLAAIAFAISTLLSSVAMAKAMGQWGTWSAFEVLALSGRLMCGSQLSGRDRVLLLKYEAGTDVLTIHLVKNGWTIPRGQKMKIIMQVDRAPPMSLSGYGGGQLPVYSDWGIVEITLGLDDIWSVTEKPQISEVINLLSSGKLVHFTFPDGDEPQWEGSLLGSRQALDAQARCIANLTRSTQPFADRPTQPFGAHRVSPPNYQPLCPDGKPVSLCNTRCTGAPVYPL